MSARGGRRRPAPDAKPGFPIARVLAGVRRQARRWKPPYVTELAAGGRTPYKILISTLLSLRTQDATTAAASTRLFALAETPRAMVQLSPKMIQRAIYPVGFYRTKAATILELSRLLLERYEGRVPDTVEALTEIKGVGRKTANLVVTLGYGRPGICVDTHVHRICNRWGYVRTRSPEETERVLRSILPRRFWIPFNDWLVTYGQNVCKPVLPHCSRCVVAGDCARRGVTRSR